MNKKYIIRYSILTGKAVWIYRNISKEGIRTAYRRACQREETRIRQWGTIVAQRKANIQRLLAKLLESVPVLANLPQEKLEAARQIAHIAETPPNCYKGFRDHFTAERQKRQTTHNTTKRQTLKKSPKNKKVTKPHQTT